MCKFKQTVKIKCPARVRIIWNKDHWIMLTICLRLRVVTHKMFKESERLSLLDTFSFEEPLYEKSIWRKKEKKRGTSWG